MAKFRKRPVVIEALDTTNCTIEQVKAFVGESLVVSPFREVFDGRPALYIRTLEGDMDVSKGDWIIKGVKGEFYPCKRDVFEDTYELVEEGF